MKPNAKAKTSTEGNNLVKIVLSDDNTLIRYTLKTFLSRLSEQNNYKIKTFTSGNGIETLGYVFVVNPDLVIVDTTLPKYSGREIMDFLIKSPKLKKAKFIILHDGVQELELPKNFIILDKFDNNFLDNFIKNIITISSKKIKLKNKFGRVDKLAMFFGRGVLRWANASDVLNFKISNSNVFLKFLFLPFWLFIQIIVSFYLAFLRIMCGEAREENIKQERQDLRAFRVMYYPTVATILGSLVFLILQVILFITGGFVILNTEVESILASSNNSITYDFQEANFDIDSVKIMGDGVIFTPSVNPMQSEESLNHQLVIFEEGVEYSNLNKIIEVSSFNNEDTSFADPQSMTLPKNSITYQVSNNKEFWAYVNRYGEWAVALDEWKSSNTVQEINKYLKDFGKNFGGDKIYVRVFLNSDGETPVELTSLSIEKRTRLVYTTNPEATQKKVSSFEPVSLAQEQSGDNLPIPEISLSSFYNGERVVYGNLPLDGTLHKEYLPNYVVRVYYSRLATEPVKGPLIGSSLLLYNETDGSYGFMVQGEFFDGHVTAELEYTTPEGEIITSDLSIPTANSSFTQ